MLLTALLAGCSAGPGFAPPSPAGLMASDPPPTPSPSPAPAPTPAPTPTASASDPSSWVIDFDGVGPAKLGVQLAVDRATLAHLTDESQASCPIAVYGSEAAPTIILVPDASGMVTAIDVFGHLWGSSNTDFRATPRTASGIGADSTLAQLLIAYPTIQKTGRYSFLDYYGITNGSGRWIVFAVDTDTGDVWGIQVGPSAGMPSELCG